MHIKLDICDLRTTYQFHVTCGSEPYKAPEKRLMLERKVLVGSSHAS